MAAKNVKVTTSSKQPVKGSLEENSIIVGTGSALKTIKIQNVKANKLPDTPGSGIDAVLVVNEPFKSSTQNANHFSLKDYLSYCNIDAVATHLSRSKEIKAKLQSKNVKLLTSENDCLIIVKNLTDTNVQNIVSFNKACAIMSATILRHTFDKAFDWKLSKYVEINNNPRVKPSADTVNRLAGQMGLTSESPYYWMIVPGYEFLYEMFPAEVIAYTLVRLQFRKELNIPDSMTEIDIISSLVMKMNRIHDLEKVKFDECIEAIGEENISAAYCHLAKDIGFTSKMRRNEEAIKSFKDLIAAFKPTLEEYRKQDD